MLTEARAHPGWRLCGLLLVQQAAALDGLSFDALPLAQDGGAAAEVDVGRGEVLQALVRAAVVVVCSTKAATRASSSPGR